MYEPPCSVTQDLRTYERAPALQDKRWDKALAAATSELVLAHQDEEFLISDAMAESDVWEHFLTLYRAIGPDKSAEEIVSLASQLRKLIHKSLAVYLADEIEARAQQIYQSGEDV